MASPPVRFLLRARQLAAASALEELRAQLGDDPTPGPAVLDGADRLLNLPELRQIQALFRAAGLELQRLESLEPLSLVPAAALGLDTVLLDPAESIPQPLAAAAPLLTIQHGTLRAGDHLQVEGSLLVLGDVNPGARVSAAGDVRVWGRLRGVAHAGSGGDRSARIVAMQLRPLQLRIADAVARGPEDPPPPGFCEEALLEGGAITIRPADPIWPAALSHAPS